MSIFKILEELQSNNSKNFKLDLLNQHKDNELLKEVIRLALDPFTVFYIKKIPQRGLSSHFHTLQEGLARLKLISSREVTGQAAINLLVDTLEKASPDNAKVLERIVLKDLRCGVATSIANTVWPNLVMDYPTMLCSPNKGNVLKNISYPAVVQLKMDGMRFNAVVKGDTCEFYTRSGQPVNLLGNLSQEFIALAGEYAEAGIVFDGELLVGDSNRQAGNGVLNKSIRGTISAEEASQVIATLWDTIPHTDFQKEACNSSYKDRFELLESLIKELNNPKISSVITHTVQNIEEATSWFEHYYYQGLEGTILKNLASPWENKRVKHQVKFKGEETADLLVVGFEEGTGKYEGMLGALVCETSDGVIKVSVGSGFNDEQKTNIKASDIVGKIIQVKYNTRIKNKKCSDSLFLPIFQCIRLDKDVANSEKEIK
jgi:hypothetical protein